MRSIYRWLGAGILTALAFVGSDGQRQQREEPSYVQRTVQEVADSARAVGQPLIFIVGRGKQIKASVEEVDGRKSLTLKPSYASPITDPNSDGYINEDELAQNDAATVEEANLRYHDIIDDLHDNISVERKYMPIRRELARDALESGVYRSIKKEHWFKNTEFLSWAIPYTPWLQRDVPGRVDKAYVFDDGHILVEVLNPVSSDSRVLFNFRPGEKIVRETRPYEVVSLKWTYSERSMINNLMRRLRDPNKKSTIKDGVETFED